MYRHAEVDGGDVEFEFHVRCLARADLVPLGVLLRDGGVLDAAQSERERGADVGEDIDGRSRIKRQFHLRIVAVRGFHLVVRRVRLVGELRGAGRQREFELGEQAETPLRIEPRIGAVEDAVGSETPALGYTVTYAVGNTLLIIWGVVIVLIM